MRLSSGPIATLTNEATLNDSAKRKALVADIPVLRIGNPEEGAKLVAFLAPDYTSYITGMTVFIDGGLMRQTGSPQVGASPLFFRSKA